MRIRDMLFKGKSKENGDWHIGSFHKDKNNRTFVFGFEVDPETVSEYSGETDRNGIKMFENDIIIYKDDDIEMSVYGIIRFGRYGNNQQIHVGFYIEWFNKKLWLRNDLGFWVDNRVIEVCGNAFDNPEFMKT